MKEPRKYNNIKELSPEAQKKAQAMLDDLGGHGLDPVINETYRTQDRQNWLYGQGRTPQQCIKAGIAPGYAHAGPIVTETLHSRHNKRDAWDIISKSTGWSNKHFFDLLESSAKAHGCYSLGFERCHTQLTPP